MTNYTFVQLNTFKFKELKEIRTTLRANLSKEINRQYAIKAEILYLQKKIKELRND